MPPENRPSVTRAHCSPRPTPLMAVVGREHLLHARASLGPFVADHDHVARLDLAEDDAVIRVFLALEDHRRARVPVASSG